MNGFELVAGIIAAFFLIGFAVGALLVIVLPASRRRRGADRWRDGTAEPTGLGDGDDGDSETRWPRP